MADKKSRLLERATATVRQPRPDRLLETGDKKKGYRVVAISLYTPEAEWIDYLTHVLQRAGQSQGESLSGHSRGDRPTPGESCRKKSG